MNTDQLIQVGCVFTFFLSVQEIVQDGYRFPANLDTPGAIGKVLAQQPGKEKASELRQGTCMGGVHIESGYCTHISPSLNCTRDNNRNMDFSLPYICTHSYSKV